MQNDFVESFLRPILDELERDLEVEFEEIGVWTNASDFDIVLNLGKERSVDGKRCGVDCDESETFIGLFRGESNIDLATPTNAVLFHPFEREESASP